MLRHPIRRCGRPLFAALMLGVGLASPAGEGADVLDGGPGRDVVAYYGRPTPVQVDLSTPQSAWGGVDDGAGDIGTAFEDVWGGDGADTLIGDAASNFLSGSRGDDRLSGGDGNDHLLGGWNSDTLNGGAGDDTVEDQDGYRDVLIDCGPGDDTGAGDFVDQAIITGCETIV